MEVNKNPNPPPSGSPPVSQIKPVRQTTNFSWAQVAAQRADEIARLTAENERLRDTVDRLPKTADGKPVHPGMELWEPADYTDEGVRLVDAVVMQTFPDCASFDECYSTREAAEAALSDAEVSDG